MSKTKEKFSMIIDQSKCIDCKACMVACKVENNVPYGFWRNWIKRATDSVGRSIGFQPGQCMQCDAPSCVEACPVGATFKADNGIVVIDSDKCVGCGNCVTACPYGARYRNPGNHKADKCNFCEHRIKRGQEPACVETCPTKARVFGDLNDKDSTISRIARRQKLIRLVNAVVDTKPSVFYVGNAMPNAWPEEPTLPGNVHMPIEFWRGGLS